MKKKVLITTVVLVLGVIMILFIATGFIKRTDVYLAGYSLSKDGSIITMNVGVAGSMGYIRDCTIKMGGDNKYITFYSTFGGLNSSIGAKNKFEVELNPLCTEIYFYHGDGGYTLVLKKNEITNEWEKVQ